MKQTSEREPEAWSRFALAFAALALLYWAAAVVGLQWSVVPGAGTAVWPAAGIAFAGLIIGGLRLWPAIVVGRLLAALTVGSPQPLWCDVLIAFGTMLGALVPALILKRVSFDPDLARMRDIFWLASAAAGLGALISAGAGVSLLWLAGADAGRSAEILLTWWFGFLVGVLVFAPLILTWRRRRAWQMPIRRWFHLAACLVTFSLVAAAVFLLPHNPFLRVWHIFPVFLWAAVAFQVRGVSICLALVSALSTLGLIIGSGPLTFDILDITDQLLVTQQFIAIAALTKLFLGAAIDERRDVEAQARLAAIVSSSPDAMVSVTPDGKIASWNRGAERLFGYTAEEALGHGVEIIVPRDLPKDGSVLPRALGGETVAIETIRQGKDGGLRNVAMTASQMRAPDGSVLGVAAVIRDITARKRIEDALRASRDHQRLLINELNHRVKNSLAIVQAIAQQSFKGANSSPAARAAFEGRLSALSAAHDLLTQENWEAASIRKVISDAMAPHMGQNKRFDIEGPDLKLPPKTAVALALALHELATNALKYGALSTSEGQVEIKWTVEPGQAAGDMLKLVWRESGGPPVRPPSQRGFGTRLIERSLAAEFVGDVSIDFAPEGVVCTVTAPVPRAED